MLKFEDGLTLPILLKHTMECPRSPLTCSTCQYIRDIIDGEKFPETSPDSYMLIVQRTAGDHQQVVQGTDLKALKQEVSFAQSEMNPPAFPGREPTHRSRRITLVGVSQILIDWTVESVL